MTGEAVPELVSAVAALARDLERQKRRLDDLVGLRDQVADLALILRDVTEGAAKAVPRAGRALTWLGWQSQREEPVDPVAAEALLRALTSWLNTVFLRYTDAAGALPECWLWHPDAVEELFCLWQAWTYAYAAASPGAATDWHDRLRPGVVRRLRSGLATCSFDSHLSEGSRRARVRTDVSPGHIALVAGWWTADPHQPPPSPETDFGEGR